MLVGELRHRITITAPPSGASLDNRGQLSGSGSTLASGVPALVEQLRGDELIEAHRQYASATHRVSFYRNSAVTLTPKCSITYGSRTLDIVGIVTDEINRFQVCLCGERL